MEWVTSERRTVWCAAAKGEPVVRECYGQVDTDGHLRSLNGLDPIGYGVLPWGSNFGGLLVFQTEADAIRYVLPLLEEEIAQRVARRDEYAQRLSDG